MRQARHAVFLGGLLLLLATAVLAAPPLPVSPSGLAGGGCPTFSWSEIAEAAGYELVVYAVSEAGEVEAAPVLSAALPAGATAWTPSADRCLTPGGSYAWSLRSTGYKDPEDWSQPALFRVAAGPSIDEVEAAIATLRRHLAEGKGDAGPPSRNVGREPSQEEIGRPGAQRKAERGTTLSPTEERVAAATKAREEMVARMRELGVLRAQIGGDLKSVAAASAPTLGSPSLTVGSDIALGPNSNLFKDGSVFLWDDTATGNTALGRWALSSATGTSNANTAVGSGALFNNQSSYNTAVGAGALSSNTTGSNNTATGHFTLSYNTEGSWNSAHGEHSLASNTTGSFNTANGFWALSHNTTGWSNTAIGATTLVSNTEGQWNTATGGDALRSNTTGNANTAHGFEALSSSVSGHDNTAVGWWALRSSIGDFNTATGGTALLNNTEGFANTATGSAALHENTTGSNNTAHGWQSLFNNTTGSGNVALGIGAGRTLGHNVTTPVTSMSDNVFIANEGGTDEQQTIRIGTNGSHARSFFAGIRDATTANPDGVAVMIDSAGQLGTVSSSQTVKQDVREVGEFADSLLALRPVAFRYKVHAETDPETPVQFGLIAEEVAEVFPELVVYDAEGRPSTVKYHLLAPLLLAELQRAEAESADFRKRLEALEASGPRAQPERWWRRAGRTERRP